MGVNPSFLDMHNIKRLAVALDYRPSPTTIRSLRAIVVYWLGWLGELLSPRLALHTCNTDIPKRKCTDIYRHTYIYIHTYIHTYAHTYLGTCNLAIAHMHPCSDATYQFACLAASLGMHICADDVPSHFISTLVRQAVIICRTGAEAISDERWLCPKRWWIIMTSLANLIIECYIVLLCGF